MSSALQLRGLQDQGQLLPQKLLLDHRSRLKKERRLLSPLLLLQLSGGGEEGGDFGLRHWRLLVSGRRQHGPLVGPFVSHDSICGFRLDESRHRVLQ